MEALLEWLGPLLSTYSAKYPTLFTVLTVMGALRVVFKPLMTLLQAVTEATYWTSKDDALYKKVVESKPYKYVAFALDWFASVKLPKK